MPVVATDTSEHQASALNSSYRHDFVIFRGSFGATYQDRKFLANAAAAADLYKRGKIAGAVVYGVYQPGSVKAQADFLWKLIGPKVPPWLAGIMIDAERWTGTTYQIRGDHSGELNTLYGMHAHRMGSYRSVIGYGNRYDFAEVWPRRDKRCRVIVAAYGSKLVYQNTPGAIGQQYTDGSWTGPAGLPNSSAPFGHCDHNVFPAFRTGASLRTNLRPSVPPKPKPTPPPAPKPYYDPKIGGQLVSKDGSRALFLDNDGQLDIRHNGTHDRYL